MMFIPTTAQQFNTKIYTIIQQVSYMFQPFSAIRVLNKEKEKYDIGYLWHGCATAQLKNNVKIVQQLLKSTVQITCKHIIKFTIWMPTNIYRRMTSLFSGICPCVSVVVYINMDGSRVYETLGVHVFLHPATLLLFHSRKKEFGTS